MPAGAFVLTARLKLQGPRNVRNIVAAINSQLRGINAQVNVQLNQNQARGLANINTQLKNTSKHANAAKDSLEAFGEQSALAIRRFLAFSVASIGFIKLVGAIKEGVDNAIQFEREMVKIAQVTNNTVKSVSGIQTEIFRLATTLGTSSDDLAKVAVTLSQAGFSARDTKIALESLAKTTLTATFTDIENTTEAAIAVMAQFKLETKDLGVVLSQINAVSAAFAVESDDLAAAIRRTGGQFKATGGELEELLALFTAIRSTTRESGESIATGLRTIFARIQRPRTVDFLEQLGIKGLRDEATDEFVGAYKAFQILSNALNKIPGNSLAFAQIIEELGGFRQISKIIPLIKNFEVAEKALAVAKAQNKSLDRDAATAQEALATSITKVKEAFKSLLVTFTTSDGIKTAIAFTLNFATALVKLTASLEKIIPLMLIFGAANFTPRAREFGRGFNNRIRPVPAFAEGGVVGGTGSGDKIPSLLEPGEFVMKKSAVQKIGVGTLERMNNSGVRRFASGGLVSKFGNSAVNNAGKFGLGAAVVLASGAGADSVKKFAEKVGIAGETVEKFGDGLAFALAQFAVVRSLAQTSPQITQLRAQGRDKQFNIESIRETLPGLRRNVISAREGLVNAVQMQGQGLATPQQVFSARDRLRDAQTQRRLVLADLKIQREQNKAIEKSITSFERLNLVTGLLSTALTVFGNKRKEEALKEIRTGSTSGENVRKAATGGLIEGAGLGLAFGTLLKSVFALNPVIGFAIAAVATLAGGLYGLNTAIEEVKTSVDVFRGDKLLKPVIDTLTKVGQGDIKTQLPRVEAGIAALRPELLTNRNRRSISGELSGQVPQMQALLNAAADNSKTFSEFEDKTRNIVRLFSELTNTPINEVMNDFKKKLEENAKQLDIEKKSLEAFADTQRRIADSLEIVAGLKDAALAAEFFKASVTDAGNAASGLLGAFQGASTGDILSRGTSGEVLDIQALNRSIDNIATIIDSGQNGRGTQSATDVRTIFALQKALPNILLDTVSRGALEEPESITKEIIEQIEAANLGGELVNNIKDNIRESISANLADPTFIRKIKTDAVGVTREIIGTLADTAKIFADAETVIAQRMSDFEEGLNKLREVSDKISGIKIEAIENKFNQFAAISNINRQPVSLLTKQSFELRRLREVSPVPVGGQQINFGQTTGLNVGGTNAIQTSDVSTLNQNFNKLKADLLTLDKQIQESANSLEEFDLREARSRIVGELNATANALDFLANKSRFAANIQEEIARRQEDREAKRGALKDVVFGSAEQRRELFRGFLGTAQVARTGNINSVSASIREQVGALAGRFQDQRLSIFGKNEVESKKQGQTVFRTGREFEDFLLGISGQGGQPLDKDQTIINKLIEDLKGAFAVENEARAALVKNLESDRTSLSSILAEQNATFLNKLRELFLQTEVNKQDAKIEKETGVIKSEAGLLEKISALQDSSVGIGRKSDTKEFKDIVQNSEALLKVDDLKNSATNSQVLSGLFGDRAKETDLTRIDATTFDSRLNKVTDDIVKFSGNQQIANDIRAELSDKFSGNLNTGSGQITAGAFNKAVAEIARPKLNTFAGGQQRSLEDTRNELRSKGISGAVGFPSAELAKRVRANQKTIEEIKKSGILDRQVESNAFGTPVTSTKTIQEAQKRREEAEKKKQELLNNSQSTSVSQSTKPSSTPKVLSPDRIKAQELTQRYIASLKEAERIEAPLTDKKTREGLSEDETNNIRIKSRELRIKGEKALEELGEVNKKIDKEWQENRKKTPTTSTEAPRQSLSQKAFEQGVQEQREKDRRLEASRAHTELSNNNLDTPAERKIKRARLVEQERNKPESERLPLAEFGPPTQVSTTTPSIGARIGRLGEFANRKMRPELVTATGSDFTQEAAIAAAQRAGRITGEGTGEQDVATKVIKNSIAQIKGLGPLIKGDMVNHAISKSMEQAVEEKIQGLDQLNQRGPVASTQKQALRQGAAQANVLGSSDALPKKNIAINKQAPTIGQRIDRIGAFASRRNSNQDLRNQVYNREYTQEEALGIISKQARMVGKETGETSISTRILEGAISQTKGQGPFVQGDILNHILNKTIEKALEEKIQGLDQLNQRNRQNPASVPTVTPPQTSNDAAKFNEGVQNFSKVTSDFTKSLSETKIEFTHTINHTGRLDVVGALEASQSISDAIVKRVVPLVDKMIANIEHDLRGGHKVKNLA